MKTCNKCGIAKPPEMFYKRARNIDGLEYTCKACQKPIDSARQARSRRADPRPKKEPTKFQTQMRAYDEAIRSAGRRLAFNQISKGKYDQLIALAEGKKEVALEEVKKQRQASYKIWNRDYQRQRLRSDPAFRACRNVRNRLNSFLKGKGRVSKHLGCTLKEFKAHIEAQFQLGMSWDNYPEWHIDHKHPLSVAYEEGSEAFAKASHYTNLQPLWATDNLKKHTKVA